MWVDYRGPLSTVYDDWEITLSDKTLCPEMSHIEQQLSGFLQPNNT